MPTHRAIQGVLQNFLGTFTSRYSDYGGYWLFGILSDDLASLHIDVLGASIPLDASEPLAAAITLARAKFREQMQKAGLPLTAVREAHLSVSRSALRACGEQQRHRTGYDFAFAASATSDRGSTFKARAVVFVAPHSSALELRSTRGTQPRTPANRQGGQVFPVFQPLSSLGLSLSLAALGIVRAMDIKWSRFASALLLLGSIVIAWSPPVRHVLVPPGPPPWHAYPENIVTLVLFVPVSLLASRWWYSLPLFFGFDTFGGWLACRSYRFFVSQSARRLFCELSAFGLAVAFCLSCIRRYGHLARLPVGSLRWYRGRGTCPSVPANRG